MTRIRTLSTFSGGGGTSFTHGQTKPFVANSDTPAGPLDNVGCRIPRASLATVNGTLNVAAGATVTGKYVKGDVVFGSASSTIIDCIIEGSQPANPSRPGLVNGPGIAKFCTLKPVPGALLDPGQGTGTATYKNGFHYSGSIWVERCDVSTVVDAVHCSSASTSDTLTVIDNYFHDKVFWFNDPAQAGASPNPGWSHGDDIQMLGSGSNPLCQIDGNFMNSFFNVEGVVWSGGSWGVGTASGGTYGTPSVALNAGYWNAQGQGNWANGVNWTGGSIFNGSFSYNWCNGVAAGSANFQCGAVSGHNIVFEGNRMATGGYPTSARRLFLASWPSGSTYSLGSTLGGRVPDPNVFDNDPSVPVGWRGLNLTTQDADASSGFAVTVP